MTDQEDLAVAEGVSGATIGSDTAYFGLVGTNMISGREVIPLFSQDRERYLEYDLTSMIYKLTREKKPKIGVVTNLPLDTGLGGMQAALQGSLATLRALRAAAVDLRHAVPLSRISIACRPTSTSS